ncbi:MAG: hypothetical protein M2R45_00412 [Verrucomicrobia subdivision 3 bacterium]|nr:hypothetical protein [Limisphaerales bacterium]MCS1413709.1 hypothetical protein [Limisphaerales bacterium]
MVPFLSEQIGIVTTRLGSFLMHQDIRIPMAVTIAVGVDVEAVCFSCGASDRGI